MNSKNRLLIIIRVFVIVICVAGSRRPCGAQDTIPLYPGKIPNARPATDEESYNSSHSAVSKVSHPTLTVYLPDAARATGTAVIICPGGGYGTLVIDREGFAMARRFQDMGVAAFVLKYRLPDDRTMLHKEIGPLQDAQQAILRVRQNAGRWHVDPSRIGIMGFSAGGHLAATAGTHFSRVLIPDAGGISVRPDFMILVYPVISMTDSLGHRGSRNNLLGGQPDAAAVQRFSNELQVTVHTPPAFLVHAGDDSVVAVANSIRFYEALQRAKVPSTLHVYARGGHGFLERPPRDLWMKDLVYWMTGHGWLPGPGPGAKK